MIRPISTRAVDAPAAVRSEMHLHRVTLFCADEADSFCA